LIVVLNGSTVSGSGINRWAVGSGVDRRLLLEGSGVGSGGIDRRMVVMLLVL
jgi:hypothetical protein